MSKTKEKIRGFAKKYGIELKKINKGGFSFAFAQEKTTVYIGCGLNNEADKEEVVSFANIVERNSCVDSTLMSKLLELNGQLLYGAFCIVNDTVFYRYNVLGGQHIDEDVFFTALYTAAGVSKQFYNKIISTHGGKTDGDFIEDEVRKKDGNDID